MQTCVSLLIAAEDWWFKKKNAMLPALLERVWGCCVCVCVCVCVRWMEGGGGVNLSCFCIDVAAFACLWLN